MNGHEAKETDRDCGCWISPVIGAMVLVGLTLGTAVFVFL